MANTPFLITGLPRSRTAWLARAATIPGWSECVHEPAIEHTNMMDFLHAWNIRPGPYAGISDYHCAQMLPDILNVVKPRTLVVLRAPEDVIKSLHRAGLNHQTDLRHAMHGISWSMGHELVRTIRYDELSDSALLGRHLQWLMPHAPISVPRIATLQSVHIEADLDANKRTWNATQERMKLAVN